MAKKINSITYKTESGIEAVAFEGEELYDKLLDMKDKGEDLIIPDEDFFKGTKLLEALNNKRDIWNWKIGIDRVQSKFSSFSFPSKPKTFGEEYQFPDEVSNLTSIDLGKWLFKLAGWKGYVLKLLSFAEIQLSILDDSFDTSLAKKIALLEKEGKKYTKDLAIGQGVMEDIGFRNLRIKLIEKKSEVAALKRLLELYTVQLDAISREISRRAIDIKAIQKGIIED